MHGARSLTLKNKIMKLNLSSQIVLNKVPVEFYQPKTAVQRSEITRNEKIPTDIFATIEEGAKHIADSIETEIKSRQREGKFCVLGLGTGLSLSPVYNELIRRHEEEGLSFKNVVVFNAYEYFPLTPDSNNRSINQLKERFLDHIDVEPQTCSHPMAALARTPYKNIATCTNSASKHSEASTSCCSALAA